MHIIIPTMGRPDQQVTWNSLQGSQYPVMLACPETEIHLHKGKAILPVPMHIKRIAATRQYIMEMVDDDHIVMMDDDLRFSRRREDDPTKFSKVTPSDVREMLASLDDLLHHHAHASIAMREGANRNVAPVLFCSRVARVIGYQQATFFETKADFRNSTVMDDFEVTLHLITRGYENAILNTFVQNQTGSGTKGGAALYRDMNMHARAAKKLARRYPEFVKTRTKKTKVAWGGQERLDVLVQWKRAWWTK